MRVSTSKTILKHIPSTGTLKTETWGSPILHNDKNVEGSKLLILYMSIRYSDRRVPKEVTK